MIRFSNCKINIGLYIVQKRMDGFHNLATIFVPLPTYDVIEILPSTKVALHIYNQKIPGNKKDNIVLKAYHLLAEKYNLPPVQIHLLKNIPVGAGLGAGSANGVNTLQLLNDYFSLQISKNELRSLAASLGSDCPFFIENQPCYATQKGDELVPIDIDFSNYTLVLVNPGIHIATPWAFSNITPKTPKYDLLNAIKEPIHQWKNSIYNDFETVVFAQHPSIKNIKETLYSLGAVYASLSGTGSTVYGFFEKNTTLRYSFPPHYWIKEVTF